MKKVPTASPVPKEKENTVEQVNDEIRNSKRRKMLIESSSSGSEQDEPKEIKQTKQGMF